jgi:hypothetical protein
MFLSNAKTAKVQGSFEGQSSTLEQQQFEEFQRTTDQ